MSTCGQGTRAVNRWNTPEGASRKDALVQGMLGGAGQTSQAMNGGKDAQVQGMAGGIGQMTQPMNGLR
eukprot:scaffold230725_cov30-Tisochrysis_lutea.AAC.4